MRKIMIRYVPICALVLGGIIVSTTPAQDPVDDSLTTQELREFAAVKPIDTHAHVFKNDPEFRGFLERLQLHLVDIVVASKDERAFPDLESKLQAAKTFVRNSGGQAVLCTTFDPFKFSNATFAVDAIRLLDRDFAEGAVAVKIWKNVGMELKDQSGRFVLPDDSRLDPIYQDIAKHGKTLIAHLAEPDSCWEPPNQNSPDYHYYNAHPEWYMFKQPDHPKKATILEARDHILERHPDLRVVGAHLGSMEKNLEELGRRFDRYPNFAVDVAARTVYLTLAAHDEARQFLIRYQDRIVYGTDLDLNGGEDTKATERAWEKQYATDWAFFSSSRIVNYRGREVKGLALPPEVLRKLYRDNAVRWIHGVIPQPGK